MKLFSPLRIRESELKNRCGFADVRILNEGRAPADLAPRSFG